MVREKYEETVSKYPLDLLIDWIFFASLYFYLHHGFLLVSKLQIASQTTHCLIREELTR